MTGLQGNIAVLLLLLILLGGCQTVQPSQTSSNSPYSSIPEFTEPEDLSQTQDETLLETQGSIWSGIIPTPNMHLKGAWSVPFEWPIIAIHAALLPNGKVFSFGTKPKNLYDGTQAFYHSVWDPQIGLGLEAHTTLPNTVDTNIFCGAQVLLGDGNLLIAGGDIYNSAISTTEKLAGVPDINIYDYRTKTLSTSPLQMLKGRWYPTMTTLANGEVLIHGGTDINERPVTTPEVWNSTTGWRVLTGANSTLYNEIWNYPWSFLAPNGKVFIASRQMWYLNPKNVGSLQNLGWLDIFSRSAGSAIMFDQGEIMVVGGGGGSLFPPFRSAKIIDINGTTPVVTTTGSMNIGRQFIDATLLADGQVLVTGGSSSYLNDINTAVYDSELWNPAMGKWTLGAKAGKPRMYHSIALLLPNGTVLKSGGDRPGKARNFNAEIYYPPYLFKKDGSGAFAARPILSTLSTPRYGQTFAATFSDATTISKVTLVRAGSVTHTFNMDQRFLKLNFTQTGNTLSIQAPDSRNIAPPGYYLLFIIDNKGVPSEAKIIKL
jgi:Domain of unknown function (DUF1929)/Glyoxal oxidase N-terminus